jgi:uncharacterized membrane protein
VGAAERDAGLRCLLAALAAAGFVISAYLTWAHVSGVPPACVGGSGGCETVQTSRYSEILGVPVAVLGMAAYATMLACAVFRAETAAVFGAFVALVGVLFSAYLTYLELFIIRAICQWCVANAVVVLAYLLLAALRLRPTGPDASKKVDGR